MNFFKSSFLYTLTYIFLYGLLLRFLINHYNDFIDIYNLFIIIFTLFIDSHYDYGFPSDFPIKRNTHNTINISIMETHQDNNPQDNTLGIYSDKEQNKLYNTYEPSVSAKILFKSKLDFKAF
jgi:hypothetical protein